MRRSLGQWFQFSALSSAAAVGAREVSVRLYYRTGTEIDDIEGFRIGGGMSFFLTFIGGGTVPIDLADVKEIRFINLADCPKGLDATIPVHQIKVTMENGRVLEGFSADLHSFSGRKSGQEWKCLLKYEAQEHTLCGKPLARIVVEEEGRRRQAASTLD